MIPRPEIAHWLAAAVALLLGLILLSEIVVGTRVFRRRAWRAYLFPSLALGSGAFLLLITIFSTFSTMHLVAHALWAEAAMIAGGVQLAVVRGKLSSAHWSLVTAGALLVCGAAFLVHEPNPWLFSRSAFLHHVIGWMLVAAAAFPLGQALRPRWVLWPAGFALTWIVLALLLFADRDTAPIFGRFGGAG
ncbi:MAG TPA: hypothetical protein VFO56_07015 [Gaiellaceae bacterium]|nr:hypothetical protein [Gaiellaceae bacterium]